MQNEPRANGDASVTGLPKASGHQIADMRSLNEGILKVIGLLNRDAHAPGISQYEMLRRLVRDDGRLKELYHGVVNPSKIIHDAVRVFAMQASSGAEASGGKRLDDVLKETTPQDVFDTIVKDILPAVITNHVQGYMTVGRAAQR